ncbi:MAG: hypothetical protein KDB07_12305, partial [Planctomycetes bacterium]|nr:hypothetical protein [Planctomycetota bacterium]
DAFAFVLQEMRKRHSDLELKQHLTQIGSDLAMAFSRRIAAPLANAQLRLGALRCNFGEACETQVLHGMFHESEEVARADVFVDGRDLESLRVAIAIDNPSKKRAWASGVDVRVQVQSVHGSTLTRSSVSIFGVLPVIDGGRREWLAFSGVDLLQEVASELEAGDEIYALRLLISRR